MQTKEHGDESSGLAAMPIEADALAKMFSHVSQALVEAALAGASDAGLVILLGRTLNAVGLAVSTIEVACDAVDPERAQHFIRWRRDGKGTEDNILAGEIFVDMLEEDATVLRLDAGRLASIPQDGATDAIAFANHLAPDVTLGFFDDVMSLLITERPGGFSGLEIELLHRVMPVFALALGARLNAAAARVLLQTYLGRNAATALLDGRVGLGEVEQIRAIVIYCDLFQFTSLTERLDPRSLIDHLNLFFETITRPVSRAGGQVSGHVGDAVVMFFPVPQAGSEGPLCAAAVKAALEGLRALELINTMPSRKMAPPLRARIGIDIGEVVHGNIGSPGRFSFTIIGTPVNRSARLQALAKELDAIMLMTSDTAKAAGVQCKSFGSHALKGFDHPVDIVGFGISCDR
ncbi:adenylate/guanylate cyclase domain-containing protein [Rhizobium sp. P40RR-XXII]|uniref:adenylate/guanylate cyclase domain-containing protein n=1 Tax=unclassified Rhizobium TaxID=2613769 RepID=UPI0014566DA7|nr:MULTISPECIES: adenylate/guanylate cyclase domain-containing protein [unclassified Rhizobium]NLR84731.1 adenylate/guanylate cyclase domain-containing protein [Rhizobium sp. P28RR-XV]NLS16362.1 adenylate/guanylate cyclase domain-containing protein [Rhizobium sp. P40RR-XXII]